MVTQILHQSGSGNQTATWAPAVVLVIDDDEHFRAMARSLLEQAGMSVLEAESVKQGLNVGSSRVDLQACKLEYSIVSPK